MTTSFQASDVCIGYPDCDHIHLDNPTPESVLLQNILDEVREIKTRMDNVEKMTTDVIAEIKPTLDELMNSSLFKMLGMKKKS